jgi:GNAT superfamily N-acetyltransferase
MTSRIGYQVGAKPELQAFVDLYQASSLGPRRPLDDPEIVQAMIDHTNLLVTAWEGELLVGLARTLTDFGYIGYLAGLVVRESHQRRGIGLELIRRTQAEMGPRSKLLLLAAPEARDYYPRIGFREISDAWMVGAREELG